MGGMETFGVRLLNHMAASGDKLFIVERKGELAGLLDPRIDQVSAKDPAGICRELVEREFDPAEPFKVTAITLHPLALGWALELARCLARHGVKSASFHIVAHPRAFFFNTKMPVSPAVLKRLFALAPVQSTYFMNLASRDSHAAYWKRDLSHYPVLRLPVAESDRRWSPRESGPARIVSVGRVVPFKGYNRAIPTVVRNLADRGLEAQWDIYGDGPDTDEVARLVDKFGVGSAVRLKGQLPYECFDETVAGYDLFVGMGTALLEAARLGMPAITALEGSDDGTYGFLHEGPVDSIGEVSPGAPVTTLEDAVSRALTLDPSETQRIGERCRQAAFARSSSLDETAVAVRSAAPWDFSHLSFLPFQLIRLWLWFQTLRSRRRA